MKALLRSAPASILGYALLILVLTAGAAQSLSGTNTVFSDDIVNGQVGYADIRDGAVGGKKLLDDSVTGNDVNEATLKPRVLTTAVSKLGADVLGSGSATRTAAGFYTVEYGFPVVGCTAQVTPGFNSTTSSEGFGTFFGASAFVAFESSTSVQVRLFVPDGATSTFTDNPFFVTLICP